jgi:hypothetical protein
VNILVLIPVKRNLPPSLLRICRRLAGRLSGENPEHDLEIVFDSRGPGDEGLAGRPLSDRSEVLARLRQSVIDAHLQDRHEAVLWIDSDIVEYPPDLPGELVARSGGGVAAPVVLLEGQEDRFYDTAGFVEAGEPARLWPPWFDQPGPVFDLDSVGSVYLVSARVYREGGRHRVTPGFTEHHSVCRRARELGLPVRAFGDLVALHANLPWYGEVFH